MSKRERKSKKSNNFQKKNQEMDVEEEEEPQSKRRKTVSVSSILRNRLLEIVLKYSMLFTFYSSFQKSSPLSKKSGTFKFFREIIQNFYKVKKKEFASIKFHSVNRKTLEICSDVEKKLNELDRLFKTSWKDRNEKKSSNDSVDESLAEEIAEKHARKFEHKKQFIDYMFPPTGKKPRVEYQELLTSFIRRLHVPVLKEIVSAVNTLNPPEYLNEYNEFFLFNLFDLVKNTEKREVEKGMLNDVLNRRDFFELMNDRFVIPKEIMSIIFSFFRKDIDFLNSVGLVNEQWYLFCLKSWRSVIIPQKKLYSIPLIVLKSVRDVCLELNHKLIQKEINYLLIYINYRGLRSLTLVGKFEKFFACLKKSVNSKVRFSNCKKLNLMRLYNDAEYSQQKKKKETVFVIENIKDKFPSLTELSIPNPFKKFKYDFSTFENVECIRISKMFTFIELKHDEFLIYESIKKYFVMSPIEFNKIKNLTEVYFDVEVEENTFAFLLLCKNLKKIGLSFTKKRKHSYYNEGGNAFDDCVNFFERWNSKLQYVSLNFEFTTDLYIKQFKKIGPRLAQLVEHLNILSVVSSFEKDESISNLCDDYFIKFINKYNPLYCQINDVNLKKIVINFKLTIVSSNSLTYKKYIREVDGDAKDFLREYWKNNNLNKDFHVLNYIKFVELSHASIVRDVFRSINAQNEIAYTLPIQKKKKKKIQNNLIFY